MGFLQEDLYASALKNYRWYRGVLGAGYDVPYYPHPMISTFFLDHRRCDKGSLARLGGLHSKSRKARNQLAISVVTGAPLGRSKIGVFKKQGFAESAFSILEFSRIRKIELESGWRFSVGEFSSKKLRNDYFRLSRLCFGKGSGIDWILKRNERFCGDKRFNGTSYIVNLYDPSGKCIATGCVACSGKWGWLFGGCVLPRYRNRGLWNSLLAARQGVSSAEGVSRWSLVTQNKFLLKKGDRASYLHLFSK